MSLNNLDSDMVSLALKSSSRGLCILFCNRAQARPCWPRQVSGDKEGGPISGGGEGLCL